MSGLVPTAPQVLVRAAGVAVAALLPSRAARAAVLAGTYAAGWAIDARGIQVRLPLPRPVAAAAYAALVALVETQVIAGLEAAQGAEDRA